MSQTDNDKNAAVSAADASPDQPTYDNMSQTQTDNDNNKDAAFLTSVSIERNRRVQSVKDAKKAFREARDGYSSDQLPFYPSPRPKKRTAAEAGFEDPSKFLKRICRGDIGDETCLAIREAVAEMVRDNNMHGLRDLLKLTLPRGWAKKGAIECARRGDLGLLLWLFKQDPQSVHEGMNEYCWLDALASEGHGSALVATHAMGLWSVPKNNVLRHLLRDRRMDALKMVLALIPEMYDKDQGETSHLQALLRGRTGLESQDLGEDHVEKNFEWVLSRGCANPDQEAPLLAMLDYVWKLCVEKAAIFPSSDTLKPLQLSQYIFPKPLPDSIRKWIQDHFPGTVVPEAL